jgi:Zn finger protein HypA/HybF involved in hydrogenase expression
MSTREYVKQIVLDRAYGRCEKCGDTLGNKYYFHYKNIRMISPETVWVLCSKCHRGFLSRRGKIH